tara:strand:+ start:1093 stop:1332 length:240 start_codon:yes stop_codon:yes gene_type:complete
MKVNDTVAITFLDHVESSKGAKAEKFTVFGRIISITKRSVIVASWAYANRRRKCDHNTTTYTILRSCIENVDVLLPKDD